MNKFTHAELDGGLVLPLVEEFYSIQGEGGNVGKAAHFLRLAGCNVCCKWCDAKESWNSKKFPLLRVEELVAKVVDSGAINVVITGGEPLLHQLDYLTTELHKVGVSIFLETSGSSPFSGDFDWVCLSPKRARLPINEAYERATELKMVIEDVDRDFEWAQECGVKVSESTLLLLQPEWSKADKILPAIVEFVKKNPRWVISLQTHKYMRIP
ncbi:MAG: 7-carboxy-7-deazaguanine synthase QueE [Rikenellaceae bacterium]